MTEAEYINATNLAKIRATKNVLRDFFPQTEIDEKNYKSAYTALLAIEARLENLVKPIEDNCTP